MDIGTVKVYVPVSVIVATKFFVPLRMYTSRLPQVPLDVQPMACDVPAIQETGLVGFVIVMAWVGEDGATVNHALWPMMLEL